MPLVAHTQLPTFARLRDEGQPIISPDSAYAPRRELHIGLLNMMPDAALEATERQFFRLVGACALDVAFHVHPFSIDGLPRSSKAQMHMNTYYESFAQIKRLGLDALIISGANVTHPSLPQEPFWQPLTEVFSWAKDNVTSVLCSCLATHAVIEYCYGIARTRLPAKRWGVFSHQVLDTAHPLMAGIYDCFDVPHSRFNAIFQADMQAKGLHILAASAAAGVHLATSPDGFRIVFFQGHPEYDDISLLKEYKREVLRFYKAEREDYPPLPENYFDSTAQAIFADYALRVKEAKRAGQDLEDLAIFPEAQVLEHLDNTWRDSAKAVFNNWLSNVYQLSGAGNN